MAHDLDFVDCHVQTAGGDTPLLDHLTEYWRCCDQEMPRAIRQQKQRQHRSSTVGL
jgi:hypothetical protein